MTQSPVSVPSMDDIMSLLRFEPQEGQIWLDEERTVLVRSGEMRALRRELIDSLGLERARGLLMRIGFLAGQKDADTARRLRVDASDDDAFLLGPQSHMLTGQVKATPLGLEMDLEQGRLYGEFLWENSFEVEAYVAEYGVSTVPVCWMQIGYASGYATRFMGREVLFKEVECIASGASCCKIVGKLAEQWGDNEELLNCCEPDRIAEQILDMQVQVSSLRNKLGDEKTFDDIIGSSEKLRQTCRLVNKAAPSKVTLLFLGETGVGKDLFAKAVHRESTRADQPFVALNCAAISKDLIEAELFGVEKGAFTGANESRPGRFERADGGTLFLDEVGELSQRAQAALLRVLQEGELERVGDTRTRRVDVRLVAASNKDLERAVSEGRFRADLLYRLNVYSVVVPPLRERLEDLPELIEHFIQRYCTLHGKPIKVATDRAMAMLRAYDWPGNIRELSNMIERGVILAGQHRFIEAACLFPSVEHQIDEVGQRNEGKSIAALAGEPDALAEHLLGTGLSLEQMEHSMIRGALRRAEGNVSKAAKLLGVTRPVLDYRLKKMANR